MIETEVRPVAVDGEQAVVVKAQPHIHLGYLDGIRGLAALYVVLRHCYMEVDWRYTEYGRPSVLPHALTLLFRSTAYTHFAVGVFIVLSGYCLMLPVARSADGRLSGGGLDYLKRRARRIMPPYYAALLISMLLIALIPQMRQPSGTRFDRNLPPLSAGSILSHLLLVHNLSPAWIHRIDGPMWSVGMEWQIYFIFPLLLLPLWRRFGNLVAMAAGLALGLAPHFLLHRLDDTCPWYIGLFAFGMGASVISFSAQPFHVALRERIRWDLIGAAICLTAVGIATVRPGWMWGRGYFLDPFLGSGAACLLIYLAVCARAGRSTPMLRFLHLPAIFTLGTFSYSLYLVHVPLLQISHLLLMRLRLSPMTTEAILLFCVVPLAVWIAYGFHLAFERPFMRSRVNR